MVPQLVDVHAAAVISEVYRGPWRNVLLFINHLANEVEHLHVTAFVDGLLKVEGDEGSGRVGIKFHDAFGWISRYGARLGPCLVRRENNKRYYW